MSSFHPKHKSLLLLVSGLLGCLFMGGSDWLMIYGDTAYSGELAWLTAGVAQVPPGRNALALFLALPGIIFYALALMGIASYLDSTPSRRCYSGLTTLGMTPWLAIHLFYVMILFLYAWLTGQGEPAMALSACEALFHQFSWLIPLGEVLMLLPFLYLVWLTAAGKTSFPRWMAINNPLVLFVILKVLTGFLPDVPARLAFLNGLMSESMALWFLILFGYDLSRR